MSALFGSLRAIARQCNKAPSKHVLKYAPSVSSWEGHWLPSSSHNTYTSLSKHAIARPACYTGQITYIEQKRFKRKRASKQDDDEEDDDEEDDLTAENPLLVDDILNQAEDGGEHLTISISSLRLDTFCKAAFSMTRAKVEESFYKGDLYVNGELPAKKSVDISVGDEIDIIKSLDPEDNKFVYVKRVVITKLPDKASENGRMKLDIQRWLSLKVQAPDQRG